MTSLRTPLLLAPAALVIALAACSPQDRQAVRNDTREATQTARNEASQMAQDAKQAAATAERGIDDAAVTTKVKAALLADSQVKGTEINVDTSNGAVTLSGKVSDPTNKQRAEQLASTIDGVRSVRNNLSTP